VLSAPLIRGNAVVSETALQAGKSRVPFLKGYLKIFIDLILRATQPLKVKVKEYQGSSLEVKLAGDQA
jgi:hypothetical protein